LSYDPFYSGKRRIQIRCKLAHRKVIIFKSLIPAPRITVLTVKDYKRKAQGVVLVATHAGAQKLQASYELTRHRFLSAGA
jgi:hypothetical protein